MTHRATLVLYKSPWQEAELEEDTQSPDLKKLIARRVDAYRANLKAIKAATPRAILYHWRGFLPDIAGQIYPQDFAKYWPEYGLALPPELQWSDIPASIRRITTAFLPQYSPPSSVFEGGRVHEGGTIVRGAGIFFYPYYATDDIKTHEAPSEIQLRYREVGDVSHYIPIEIILPPCLKAEPLLWNVHQHIDRIVSPPLQLKDNTIALASIRELNEQIYEKLKRLGINSRVLPLPKELLYIGEALNVPVLTQSANRDPEIIFINPLLARVIHANINTPHTLNPTELASVLGVTNILEKIQALAKRYRQLWKVSSPTQEDYLEFDQRLADIWQRHADLLAKLTGPLLEEESTSLQHWWKEQGGSRQQLIFLPYTLPTLTALASGDKCNTAFWPLEKAEQQPERDKPKFYL